MAHPNLSRGADELSAPATQFIADREAYLDQGRRDIGRRVSATEIELFVSGDAPAALQQQLIDHAPDYIALSDVAGQLAQGVLAALSSACQVPLQRLAIRRQGQGVALAELPFIELQAAGGLLVRIFGNHINADTRTRQSMALTLLAHSRLGVLMVSELPRHSIPAALAPFREAIAHGPWGNGNLLVVPLAAMPTLGVEAAHLGGRSGVSIELVSVAKRSADAVAAVFEAWNRLQQRQHTSATLTLPRPSAKRHDDAVEEEASWAAATVPMGLDPETSAPVAQASRAAPAAPFKAAPGIAKAPMPVPGGTRWDDHVRRVAALRGVLACSIFDQHSDQCLASAGARPSGERLAEQGAALVRAMSESGRCLGAGTTLRDATLNLGRYQLVLLAQNGHPGLWLHLVVESQLASVALTRAMVEKLVP